ncbi:MAG: serine hydrolase, partial [Chitinophagaceae bacterium]
SITKQFTAAVILKLQEQKKLSLDDKITKYFPGYPKGDSITIRNLLTHSSGIFNYTENQKFMQSGAFKATSKDSMLALFRDVPLNFAPGTKYSYSNSGYVLLGQIIEKVTGKSYESNIHDLVFRPYKMSNSGFDFKNLASDDKATGYNVYREMIKMPASVADSTTTYSAGAIYSTTGDLLKWHNALQSTTLLSKKSLALAYTPMLDKYALGWVVDTVFAKRTVMHGGGIFGFNTNIQRLPEDDVVVVLLCNMNIAGLEQISRGLLSIVYNQPYEVPKGKVAIKVDEKILQQYVGEYELKPGVTMKIMLANGNLKVQVTGQQAFDMFAESEDKFFLKIVEASAVFHRDAEGKVDKLIWTQGIVQEAKKIK